MRIKLRGMCRHELMRVMCSWRFYISLLIYISIVFIAGHMDVVKNSAAESMLIVVTGVSNFDVVLLLTASFPFACSFCDDWNDRYINSVVIRSNVISYAAAKMVVCALTSFAVSFVGLNVSTGIWAIRYGCDIQRTYGMEISKGRQFYDIAASSFPYMVIIVKTVCFSLATSAYASIAFAISSIIPNSFVAATLPLMVVIIIRNFFGFLPDALKLPAIQGASGAYATSTSVMLIMSLMVVIGYIVLAGCVFYRFVKRRVGNEII